jgi:hypothetical protein
MSSLTHYDVVKVDREYEKLRIHLVADLCRLNTALPLALMLRRSEIDRIARDLVRSVRKAPYRRQGPLLVRLVEGIRFKASSAMQRSGSEVQAERHQYESGEDVKGERSRDELSITFGDVPNIPFASPPFSDEAEKVRAANTNRPRP